MGSEEEEERINPGRRGKGRRKRQNTFSHSPPGEKHTKRGFVSFPFLLSSPHLYAVFPTAEEEEEKEKVGSLSPAGAETPKKAAAIFKRTKREKEKSSFFPAHPRNEEE